MNGTRTAADAEELSTDEPLAGLAVGDAAERVAATTAVDERTARAVLADASDDDGTVTWDAVEATLGRTANVVATPETRLELATNAVETAQAAAAPVADHPPVRGRLNALGSRHDAVSGSVDALSPRLRNLAARAGADGELYAVMVGSRRLRGAANDCAGRADELAEDAEAFAAWVEEPQRRRAAFGEEVDALADALDGLAATLAPVEAGEADTTAHFEAGARSAVTGLLVADLRADLAHLRGWPGGDDGVDWGEPAERLDELAARQGELRARTDAALDDERAVTMADALASHTAPVEWGDVQRTIDAHRPA